MIDGYESRSLDAEKEDLKLNLRKAVESEDWPSVISLASQLQEGNTDLENDLNKNTSSAEVDNALTTYREAVKENKEPAGAVRLSISGKSNPYDAVGIPREVELKIVPQGRLLALPTSGKDEFVLIPNPVMTFSSEVMKSVFPSMTEQDFRTGNFKPRKVMRTKDGFTLQE